MQTLESAGIINKNLYVVSAIEAQRYNDTLKRITGLEIKLTEFRIDKRGESPEIERELGPNYLQINAANRYVIIVSPNQANADLIHEEFSFDDEFLSTTHMNAFPAITAVTRVDALFGEIWDGCEVYNCIEDLLLIKRIRLALESPSDFTGTAHELAKLEKKLRKNPALLASEGEELLQKMAALARKVGDIRKHNLSGLVNQFEIVSFFTRLFDGVAVYREHAQGRHTIPVHHPDETITLADQIGAMHTGMFGETHVFCALDLRYGIYRDSEAVTYHDLTDKVAMMRFLTKRELITYDPVRVNRAIMQLQDAAMLAEGLNVAEFTIEDRKRQLGRIQNHYGEIVQVLELVRNSLATEPNLDIDAALRRVDRNIPQVAPEVRAALAVPTSTEPGTEKVTNWMLDHVFPYHYRHMLQYNRRTLERGFDASPDQLKAYIIKYLTGELPWL